MNPSVEYGRGVRSVGPAQNGVRWGFAWRFVFQMGGSLGGSSFRWGARLVARVFLGGDILGSKEFKHNYLLQLPQKLQLPPSIDPTLHQQLNLQLLLQLQLHRRTTVHWPTRVHQDGVIRGGTDIVWCGGWWAKKKVSSSSRARGGAYLRARARLRLRALARACARADAPMVAGACKDATSMGPSSFRDHVVGVITQSPSQMPSWWQL